MIRGRNDKLKTLSRIHWQTELQLPWRQKAQAHNPILMTSLSCLNIELYIYIYIFIAGLKKCKNWTGIWKINLRPDLRLLGVNWITPWQKSDSVLFVDPTVFTYTMNEFDNVSIYLKSCVDINVHSKQAVSS